MITTHFEGVGMLVEGADRSTVDHHRATLLYNLTVISAVAPPHELRIPGEAIPALIALLQGVVKQYPQLTTERAKEGTTNLSGLQVLPAVEPGKGH